jgi:manganese/zinc/iron transport system permease protein
MSDDLAIMLTAAMVGTACALLGPFLVLRRVALMSDAVSHAVLPGIVLTFLVFHTMAPLPMVAGAAAFAVVCVLGIDALRSTGLVRADAAIGLVFPTLFALGVIGVTRYASDVHLDLDATIYGEIAFVPFDVASIGGFEVPRAMLLLSAVMVLNLSLLVLLWKEYKASTFDPDFSRSVGLRPALLSRLLLVAVAITAVASFESVGAILVVSLLIVPAATAYLLTDRLRVMVGISIAVAWIAAVAGFEGAVAADASIAGAMGLVCGACFALALLASPRHGLVARLVRRQLRRRAVAEPPPAV